MTNVDESMLSIISDVWKYSLVSVDQSPIRVSNIFISIILVGIWVRYNNLLKKLAAKITVHFDNNARIIFNKMIFVILSIIYFITVLQIANIPLSALAFLGGAFVIGVGIGAREIISNFISSLIIIAEKSIKIGEIITINNITGKVHNIGNRYVCLSIENNTNILIPNTLILQNNIIKYKNFYVKFNIKILKSEIEAQKFNVTILKIKHILELDLKEYIDDTQNHEVYFYACTSSHLIITFICSPKEMNILQLQHIINMTLIQNLGINIEIEQERF